MRQEQITQQPASGQSDFSRNIGNVTVHDKGVFIGRDANNTVIITGDGNEVTITGMATLSLRPYRQESAILLDFYSRTFVGRDDWESELARFAAQEAGGYLLLTAGPGIGKSALIAHLIHRYETDRWPAAIRPRLLYFFIRQEDNRNTPKDFLHVINSQLLQLLDESGGVRLDMEARISQFRDLWARTVVEADATHPLLLLIDGLDEMAGGEQTIAHLLPAYLGSYVHVIVTSRPVPDPQQQVSTGHPLKTAMLRQLDAFSPPATELYLRELGAADAQSLAPRVWQVTRGEPLYVRYVGQAVIAEGLAVLNRLEEDPPDGVVEYFTRQLNELVERAEGEVAWELLGLLLEAQGGLSRSEMAAVLERPQRVVDAAIEGMQRFFLSDERLEFNHAQLRLAVAEKFTLAEREQFQQKLLAWGKRYETDGWPDNTPAYLLAYYAEHLMAAKAYDQLYDLVGPRWLDLQLSRNDTYMGFIEDAALAIRAADESGDLVQAVRNRFIYARLSTLASGFEAESLGLMASLGQVERAQGYAAMMSDPRQQAEAYRDIGQALLDAGKPDKAKANLLQVLAATKALAGGDLLTDELRYLVVPLAQAGALDDLLAFIYGLTYAGQAGALGEILAELQWAENEVAGRVAEILAELLTAEVDQPAAPELIIGHLSLANYYSRLDDNLAADRYGRQALTMAGELAEPEEQLRAWNRIGSTLRFTPQKDIALQAARALLAALGDQGNPLAYAGLQSEAVLTLSYCGQLDEALRAATEMPDPGQQLLLFSELALEAAGENRVQEVDSLANQTVGGLTKIERSWQKRSALKNVLAALTRLGKTEEAIVIVEEQLADPVLCAVAYSSIATALARGEEEADRVNNLVQRALYALVDIASDTDRMEAVREKEMDRAEAIVDIASELESLGYLDEFLSLADDLEVDEAREYAYARLAEILIDAGRIDDAHDLAQQLTTPRERNRALPRVAQAFLQADARLKALAILQTLQSSDSAMVVSLPMADFRLSLARALIGWVSNEQLSQLLNEGWQLTFALPDSPTRADLLYWFSWGFAEIGEAETAIQASRVAWETSQKLGDYALASEMFANYIRILHNCDRVREARSLLANPTTLRRSTEKAPTAAEMDDIKASIARAWSGLDNFSAAVAKAREMQQPFWQAKILGMIALQLAWAQQRKRSWRGKISWQLKQAVSKLGGQNLAPMALADEVLQVSRNLSDSEERLALLESVANVRAVCQPQSLIVVVKAMLVLPTGDDPFVDALSASRVRETAAINLAKAGAVEQVMRIINDIQEQPEQASVAAIAAENLPSSTTAGVGQLKASVMENLATYDGPVAARLEANGWLGILLGITGDEAGLQEIYDRMKAMTAKVADYRVRQKSWQLLANGFQAAWERLPGDDKHTAHPLLEAAYAAWLESLVSAHLIGLETVYRCLQEGANLLTARDADMLWTVYETVKGTETWDEITP